MNKVLAKTHNLEIQKKIFWLLVSGVVISIIMYATMVNRTIYNIAMRQRVEVELSEMRSDVSKAELAYFDVKNIISPQLALSLGFHTVVTPFFLTDGARSSNLSLNADNR
jgi:hypothetical protein